jgi:hypothetical protein
MFIIMAHRTGTRTSDENIISPPLTLHLLCTTDSFLLIFVFIYSISVNDAVLIEENRQNEIVTWGKFETVCKAGILRIITNSMVMSPS